MEKGFLMQIVPLLLILGAIALVAFLIARVPSIPPTGKQVVWVVAAILMILVALNQFGISLLNLKVH